jgi:hypothetical protein
MVFNFIFLKRSGVILPWGLGLLQDLLVYFLVSPGTNSRMPNIMSYVLIRIALKGLNMSTQGNAL